MEEVAELRQRRQRQLEQDLREDVEEFMDLGAHERGTHSDVELFASEDEGEEEEESDDSADETEDVPFRWSNVLGEIDIEEFSARHGPTKDLGDRATSNDFLNLFIDDDYLDEIVQMHYCLRPFERRSNLRNYLCGNFSLSRTEHLYGNP